MSGIGGSDKLSIRLLGCLSIDFSMGLFVIVEKEKVVERGGDFFLH